MLLRPPLPEDEEVALTAHKATLRDNLRCATEILRQSLKIIRDIGVDRVLVTCDEGNVASAKTIERCGGVFESLVEVPGDAVPKRRYWFG